MFCCKYKSRRAINKNFDNFNFWNSLFSKIGPYFCRLILKWTEVQPKNHFTKLNPGAVDSGRLEFHSIFLCLNIIFNKIYRNCVTLGSYHRLENRCLFPNIYDMKNQFWAGLGSRASTWKKSLGPIMSNFWGCFFMFS